MSADAVLKLVASFHNDPAEVVVVATGPKEYAARARTSTAVLYEGTGSTTDDAVTALLTAVTDAMTVEATALEAKAAVLREALKD